MSFGLCLGCASSPAPHAPQNAQKQAPIEVPTTVVTSEEALGIEELLSRAQLSLQKRNFEDAIRDFRLVAEHAKEQEFRVRGLLGWGTALDLGGRPRQALPIYQRAASETADEDLRITLNVRIVRLFSYAERYREAGELSRTIDVSSRPPLEQIALHAARALSELEGSNMKDAERSIGLGRGIIFDHSFDQVQVPPLDVAALYFAQGEVHRLRARAIRFRPLPVNFLEQLEARCQLILDSQGAFSEAMRSEDAHWSSMSGVRVGELYQDLHRDLMDLPLPAAVDTVERRQLFEGALRLRYSGLLRKSLSMMQATVALLERNQQESPWRQRAREALSEIEEAQQREEKALDALPYSREQLRAALEHLERKAKSAKGGS
jgi:tetratricopeptide (TPR) repeat protein